MNGTRIATTLFLGAAAAAWTSDHAHLAAAERTKDRGLCMVEVLHSEELPGAPIFQNLARERLRVTAPQQPPFETTVERLMPWQVPPPRRGQRLKLACDSAVLNSFSFY